MTTIQMENETSFLYPMSNSTFQVKASRQTTFGNFAQTIFL